VNRSKNSPEHWDRCWRDPAQAEWRAKVLANVYARIVQLVPPATPVIDLGGGVGTLAQMLIDERGCACWVFEHNDAAVNAVRARGLHAVKVDLERDELSTTGDGVHKGHWLATEVLEHLSYEARCKIYRLASGGGGLLASVPNNRLGPDEEPEHTVKFTALSFLTELREVFGDDCRVECIDGFLLGVAGPLAHKPYRLSVCFPARDEAADVELTLASFRAIADEMVIGVDPRSKDATAEVAARYAEKVFVLDEPEGPAEDRVQPGGVHFAWIRNQCIDRCTGDWVFMTEAHEGLVEGVDPLLGLDKVVPDASRVVYVLRTGTSEKVNVKTGETTTVLREQWAFPWLFRRAPDLRFRRSTHNVLDTPEGELCVRMPQVKTLHRRATKRAVERREQRAKQNRHALLKDWLVEGTQTSLLYLGSEWRDFNPAKAVERFEEFLAVRRNGEQRYHVRLLLAKEYVIADREEDARVVLHGADGDDWTRVEHWVWLGDIAHKNERWDEAIQFYLYAATRIGNPPFTLWWIDLGVYGYIPAMRLAECYAVLGKFDEALTWARKVEALFPDGSDESALAEIRGNIEQLEKCNAGAE
jgi:hypothetical protein